MRSHRLRKFLAVSLLFSILSGCGPETPPPDAKPERSPTPKPAASPTPVADARSQSTPSPAARPHLPTDNGPQSWPVTLPLGKDGRAAEVPRSSDPKTRWQALERLPSIRANPGEGGQAQVFRDGTFARLDAESGRAIYWMREGIVISAPVKKTGARRSGRRGEFAAISEGTAEGASNEWLLVDHTEHLDPFHHNGAQSLTENDDGSRTSTYTDGSTRTSYPDGGAIITPPPGSTGTNADDANNSMAGRNDHDLNKPSQRPTDKHANGNGEPHYTTRDGTRLTTQAAGEFILVTGLPGREVQARHQPYRGSESVSAITSLAMRVGGAKVEVRLDGTVLIDGLPATAAGDCLQGDLPGGGAVGVWRYEGRLTNAVVVWPDLSVVYVQCNGRYLNVDLQWSAPAPEHHGLLGSNDGHADNDLTDRTGKVCRADDLPGVAAFVESWRVTDAESLFTYAPGESTATYTIKGFPKNPPDLSAHRAEAEAAAAGLPPGPLRDDCIYDIEATGDVEFAKGYAEFAKLLANANARASAGPPASTAPTPTPTPSPTATPPVESGDGIAITPAEMAAATPMEAGQQFKMKLGAGESRVYKFQPGKDDNLTIYPADLSSFAAYRPGVDAGFAWFDDKGKMVGKPHQVHDDGPSPLDHPTGTYYLKIVGPGDVDIHHH